MPDTAENQKAYRQHTAQKQGLGFPVARVTGLICALMIIGVDICFRKHQSRHTDFRKGRRLGKYDHVVSWKKGVRPEWMSKEEYASLPSEITLREIRYVVDEPGRKQEPFVVVTTILEPEGETGATRDELAEMYGYRWNIELDIRSIRK